MQTEVIAMRMRSVVSFALPLILAVPSVACGGSVTTEQPATAAAVTTRAPIAQSAHGPTKLIGDALGDVPLTAAQRTELEQLAADTEARHANARAAGKDMMLALAGQVEAGTLDRASLKAKVDAVAAALVAAQPADRAAFQKLHDLLGPDQRVAFVDAFEARAKARFAGAGEAGPSGGGGPGKGMMGQWAADLALTDAQKQEIKAALEQRRQAGADGEHGPGRPMREGAQRAGKLLEAFKQDRFVLDEVAPPRDIGQMTSHASERFIGLAEIALPVLTPQQRALAAQKIRERVDATEVVGPATL
jgi:Spy/CpxP family protein refolding chaperone